jgi:hypothetical protein
MCRVRLQCTYGAATRMKCSCVPFLVRPFRFEYGLPLANHWSHPGGRSMLDQNNPPSVGHMGRWTAFIQTAFEQQRYMSIIGMVKSTAEGSTSYHSCQSQPCAIPVHCLTIGSHHINTTQYICTSVPHFTPVQLKGTESSHTSCYPSQPNIHTSALASG